MNKLQDTIKKEFQYKTNAITLVDKQNKELKDACIKSGGIYIHIDDEYLLECRKNNTKKINLKWI